MKPATAAAARRVQEILGPGHAVLEFGASTRSAAEAAAAIGCAVGQIAKSLIFRAASGRPVLVIAPGTVRIDEARLAAVIGEPVGRADAAFVREATGFAIGGVPPVGHRTPPVTVIEAGLLGCGTVWAAAGTPNAVFEIAPAALVALTGGTVAAVAA